MCGIYCSNDLSTFEVLEQANRKRGNFSFGMFYCYHNSNYKIVKSEGSADWDKLKIPTGKGFLYLGHNQAPTETGRKWQTSTSHPFLCGDWVVGHNGIITNYNELIDEYVPYHSSKVDSSIIPAMLAESEYKHGPCEDVDSEIQNILFTIERLKGTFALWIVHIKTMNVYIARQGSTLFYKGSNISSIKGKHYREVKEGILYNYSYEGLTPVEGFIADSPFLTL